MKNTKLSKREMVMVAFLLILIIGVVYYMAFYVPLQEELASIASQSANLDTQITTASAKITRMRTMQTELDEILARPAEELTEIAPYDNKEVVMNQLHAILSTQTLNYSLSNSEPAIGSDGTVRRNISLSFGCADYEAAKEVIRNLTNSQWRCLVSNLVINSSSGDLFSGAVSVSATITFFEHTGLTK